MKILHLISSGGYYGAENMIVNLSQSLRRNGHEATIGVFLNKHHPNCEIADVAKSAGIPVETILCSGRLDRSVIPTLAEKFERLNVDIVHSHGYKPDTYALAASKHVPKRLVATCHTWPLDSMALRVYKVIDCVSLRRFDQTVAVSETIAGILRDYGVREEKIATIANGIDLSPFHGATPTLEHLRRGKGLMVGVVAQLMFRKGQGELLRAIPSILKQAPDTVFVLAGDGPDKKNYENMVREMGIEKNAYVLGKRKDMPGVYASLDVMILPSFDEGMPMAILEAMASAKTVIGTPVGDVPKLVLHEKTGLMTKAGNVEEITSSLLRVIQDDSLRQKLANNAFEWVQNNFTADAMAAKYLNLYERVLQ